MQAAIRRPAAAGSPRLRGVMPGGMLVRELLVTAARPRALAIKLLVPLVLTVPLLAGHAPTFWAAMLLTVLAAMTGAVGSAVTLARARESGLLTRLALSPRPAWRTLWAWAAGAAIVDAVQLAPALVVVLLLAPVTLPAGCALVASVVAVLLLANALGCAVAAVGGGPGEVLLDVAVLLAPLLFLGGLFTGVPRSGWRWWAALVDPFTYTHAAFIGALGGDPVATAPGVLVAAAVTAVVALALLVAVAPAVVRPR